MEFNGNGVKRTKKGLITLGGHGNDGFRGGVVLVFHPWVVLFQQLRERRRFGQQLADHVPADVGSLLQSEYAEDLGLDTVESHLFAVFPKVAGRALLPTLSQQPGSLVHLHGKPCGGDGQRQKDEHPGEKKLGAVTLRNNAVWACPPSSGSREWLI